MQRRDFIAQLGLGAAFVLTTSCLGSCTKSSNGPVDFTLNLDDAANAALKTKGGYIVTNNVVVAQGTDGNYYAATVVCSHEGRKQVVYKKSTNQYYCSAHGALFDLQGNGLNGNGKGGLEVYQTTVTGTSLRVFS
jgi:nitrite reductase/ring-hydroxylating ferredoxin subunit